jgi:hypothetical protein
MVGRLTEVWNVIYLTNKQKYLAVAPPESSMAVCREGGGTTTEWSGKLEFNLSHTVVPNCQLLGSQKQLFVVPPIMFFAKVAVVW